MDASAERLQTATQYKELAMSTPTSERPVIDSRDELPDWDDVMVWRYDRLTAVGFDRGQAVAIAANRGYDLHALLALVGRGCPPQLAARIVAPVDDDEMLPRRPLALLPFGRGAGGYRKTT